MKNFGSCAPSECLSRLVSGFSAMVLCVLLAVLSAPTAFCGAVDLTAQVRSDGLVPSVRAVSGTLHSSTAADKAFDGDVTQGGRLFFSTETGTLQYDFPAAFGADGEIVVTSYKVVRASANTFDLPRAPTVFSLEGSADGETWNTLHAVDESAPVAWDWSTVEKTFDIAEANLRASRSYRFVVTRNNGSTDAAAPLAIAELVLYGEVRTDGGRPAPTVVSFRLMSRESTPGDPPVPSASGPKVSILGDSYSTFAGWLPGTNITWYTDDPSGTHYAETDCHNVSNTWWHQVVTRLDADLLVNESYSGTLISNCQPPPPLVPRGPSFLQRATKLSRDGDDPDLIFIFGGTNDRALNVNLGSLVWSGWTDAQLINFAPAVAKTFCLIEERYPKARKIVVINTNLGAYDASVNANADTGLYADILKDAAAHMKWETVALKDIAKQSGHPTVAGQKAIAEQVLAVVEGQERPAEPETPGESEDSSCDLSNARIAFYDPDPAVHTGSPVTPAVIVSLVTDGVETRLPYDAYALSYENNTAVGTARVTATGKGDFSGSCSATFTIAADTAQNFAKGEDGRYTACDYANTMTTLSRRGDDPSVYRTYTVAGDSYSSWDPRIPLNASGCPYYYPNEDVLLSMSRMWHGYLATMNGGWQCVENSSFSGGCAALIAGSEYRSAPDADGKAMYGDAPNRMAEFGKDADIIFLFLGINDMSLSPLGEYKFCNWSNDDLGTFRGAYAYCVKMARRNNPSARIVCLTYGNLAWQQGYLGGAMAQSVQYIARRMGVECLNLPILRSAVGAYQDDFYHHDYSTEEIAALTGLDVVKLETGSFLQKEELGAMGHPCNIGMYRYAMHVNRYLNGEISPDNGVMDDSMDMVDPDAPHAGYTLGTLSKNGQTAYRGIIAREIADCERFRLEMSLTEDAPFKVYAALNNQPRSQPVSANVLGSVLTPGQSLVYDSADSANWIPEQAKLTALRALSFLQIVAMPVGQDEYDSVCPAFENMRKYISFQIKKY